jgi:hypothetical protein
MLLMCCGEQERLDTTRGLDGTYRGTHIAYSTGQTSIVLPNPCTTLVKGAY